MGGVMTEAIRGFWVAAATPLTSDGGVDPVRLATHAQWLFGRGVDGVVLFGTTGEGTSFNVAERIATVEALLKAGVAAERIGIGGGFPAISDSIALTRAVLGLGLRHVLLLPPYFDRSVTPEGIEDAFAAIIDEVADDRVRATLYHIPQVSGVAIPTSVAANLRKRYGKLVAGLKIPAATSSNSGRSAARLPNSPSPSAMKPTSPARSRRAVPAPSAAWPISYRSWSRA